MMHSLQMAPQKPIETLIEKNIDKPYTPVYDV